MKFCGELLVVAIGWLDGEGHSVHGIRSDPISGALAQRANSDRAENCASAVSRPNPDPLARILHKTSSVSD